MKAKILYLAMALVMAIALAATGLAATAPVAAGQQILLFDDFNDGDDAGWEVIEGSWSVVDGVYVGPDPGVWNVAAKTIRGENSWSDYVFEGRFMLDPSGCHEATVLFRVQWALPGINYGEFYQILNGPSGQSLQEMYGQYGGGESNILGAGNYDVGLGIWHDFKVVLNGTSVEYYIDGNLVISYDGLTAYSTGKIGLKTAHYGRAFFDDIRVSVLAANTPVGSDVTVVASDSETGEPTPVTVTFENVNGAGDTTVTTSSTGPPLPTSFKLGSPPTYFDLTTTADYDPPVTVCIDYSGVTFHGPESKLTLLQKTETGWDDITLRPVDTLNKVICGQTSSLSWFTVVEPIEDEGEGCFIATAAYGTSTAEEIDTLRAFRDEVLLQNSLGSRLVTLYYEVSPPVADFISEHEPLRTLVRELLVDPVTWLVEATGTLWRN